MNLLLDTHLLLWAAAGSSHLPEAAKKLIEDFDNALYFSAASVWEIAIKRSLGRDDFSVDPRLFKRGLLDNGYLEIPLTSEHAITVDSLPMHHRDPFDRILIAQSINEGVLLLTSDSHIGKYEGPIRMV